MIFNLAMPCFLIWSQSLNKVFSSFSGEWQGGRSTEANVSPLRWNHRWPVHRSRTPIRTETSMSTCRHHGNSRNSSPSAHWHTPILHLFIFIFTSLHPLTPQTTSCVRNRHRIFIGTHRKNRSGHGGAAAAQRANLRVRREDVPWSAMASAQSGCSDDVFDGRDV